MTPEPEDPLLPHYVGTTIVDDEVELVAHRDPLALALELVRSASAVTIAVALVVIAFALT